MDESSEIALTEKVPSEAATDDHLAATPGLPVASEAVPDRVQPPLDALAESPVGRFDFDLSTRAELRLVARLNSTPPTFITLTFVPRTPGSPLPLPVDSPHLLPAAPQPSSVFGSDEDYPRCDREQEKQDAEVEDRTRSLAPLPSSPLLPQIVESPWIATPIVFTPFSCLAFSSSPSFPTVLANPPTSVSYEVTTDFFAVPADYPSSLSNYDDSSAPSVASGSFDYRGPAVPVADVGFGAVSLCDGVG